MKFFVFFIWKYLKACQELVVVSSLYFNFLLFQKHLIQVLRVEF